MAPKTIDEISRKAHKVLRTRDLPSCPAMPAKYIPIERAGVGSFGTVDYCISRRELDKVLKSGGTKASESLKDRIVAIKRFYTGGKAPAQLNKREIITLKIIQQSADPLSLKMNISQLVDYDMDHSLWHATAACYGPTLRQFLRKMADIVPECFFFHIFLQSLNALRFLHALSPYAIAHGDLHEGNILVNLQDVLYIGLPRLVLIDFGMSLPKHTGAYAISDEQVHKAYGPEWNAVSATSADFVDDLYNLSAVLHDLNAKSHVVRADDLFKFIDVACCKEQGLTAERAWKEWGRIAMERRWKMLLGGIDRLNGIAKM